MPRGQHDTWNGLLNAYFNQRKRPHWTGWSNRLPGLRGRLRLSDVAFIANQGGEARVRVRDTIRALRKAKLLPQRPSFLTQPWVNRIVRAVRDGKVTPRIHLPLFWEAVVLRRRGYRCDYCGRR